MINHLITIVANENCLIVIIFIQLLLDTGFSTLGREAEDDFTTQFLHSPMFDSLREKVNTKKSRQAHSKLFGNQTNLKNTNCPKLISEFCLVN